MDGWLLTTDATLQLSPVVGVPNKTPVAVHPVLVVVFILVGQVMVGFTLSATFTTCMQVDEFPAASIAVHVTFVLPNGYVVDG